MGYQKRCLQVHIFISSADNEVAGIYVGAHSRIPQPSGRNISSRPDYGDWSRLVFGVTGPQMDDDYPFKSDPSPSLFRPMNKPKPTHPLRIPYQSDVHSNAIRSKWSCLQKTHCVALSVEEAA